MVCYFFNWLYLHTWKKEQSKTCHRHTSAPCMFLLLLDKNAPCQLISQLPWWSLAKPLSGNPLVCRWPLAQASPLICWKWDRLCRLNQSSWKMKPEQVAHFVVRADRKEHLVVMSSVWKSSSITLLLMQNFLS